LCTQISTQINTHTIMSAVQISSREFRNKQKIYFDLASTGTQVIVKRNNEQFLVTHVRQEDITISPKMEKEIEMAIKQARNGNVITIKSQEELNSYLENL